MDAVKEAVLEQKIDDLSMRFDRIGSRFQSGEERNREEHREIEARNHHEHREMEARNRRDHQLIRAEVLALRGAIDKVNRTLALGLASMIGSVIASVAAVIVAHSL